MSASDGRVIGTAKIVDHGPAAARWNAVVLSEGYRESELGQFAGDAQRFADALLATTPFDENERAINVFRVDVASTDSGADDPEACGGTGATPATFFDATYCGAGIDRLLLVDTETVMETASDAVPEWHVAVVIVNATKYGGSGAAGVPVYSLAADAEKIAIHELGHSGFGLADEYCEARRRPATATRATSRSSRTSRQTPTAPPSSGAPTCSPAPRCPPLPTPDCTGCDPQPSPIPALPGRRLRGRRPVPLRPLASPIHVRHERPGGPVLPRVPAAHPRDVAALPPRSEPHELFRDRQPAQPLRRRAGLPARRVRGPPEGLAGSTAPAWTRASNPCSCSRRCTSTARRTSSR